MRYFKIDMKNMYKMMNNKVFYYFLSLSLLCVTSVFAQQQVPNPGFEDWSAAQFDGEPQPASWHASHVEQVGMKFNFAHREAGHTGNYSMMVQDQEVGAMGITETSPGYFSLGQPWSYLPSITQISGATAGTYGGINFTSRPDTMAVWIKRTGDNWNREDFYLLFYSWKGTAIGNKYKAKDGSCTSVTYTDEESDIRQAVNGNECGTATKADPGQIAEGMWREKKQYGSWTLMKVPIYYMRSEAPDKMNIIFSASNYPNFRANSGLYVGNSLYVDDVSLIYASTIQTLIIGNKVWNGFDPNSSEEQIYSLGEHATTIPTIEARRGVGSITNAKGNTSSFPGRVLTSQEMTIQNGQIDGAPTIITVTAADGSSTHTYKIKFVRAASTNARLSGIEVGGEPVKGFAQYTQNYQVALPYGTTSVPEITPIKQEEDQVVSFNQPTSLNDVCTINVTAPDGTTHFSYTLTFTVAPLADNRLADILINGVSLPGFDPDKMIYKKVSLPLTTTTMPEVTPVPMYPGEQTIVETAPQNIDGGTYMISVTTPGAQAPYIYKLTFKIEISSYSLLSDLWMGDEYNFIQNFDPEVLMYRVNLPIGTEALPTITPTLGDEFQTVDITEGGLDGTTLVTVTAANGDQSVYKLVVSTEKSTRSDLAMIYYELDGERIPVPGFSPSTTIYNVSLPIGTEADYMPVSWDLGDEYEKVTLTPGATTKISVKAGDGSTTLYMVKFSVNQSTVDTLSMIYLNGEALPGFDAHVMEYAVTLPKSTTVLPAVTYDKGDIYQTVSERSAGVNGDYKIIVRPQSGASRTYTIHFSVEVGTNNYLESISLNGVALEGFDREQLTYTVDLEPGQVRLPTVEAVAEDPTADVHQTSKNKSVIITVTSEDGQERVYRINFVAPMSGNAQLAMIKVGGEPLEGFADSITSYQYYLSSDTCPAITVVPKDNEQQIIIMAPAGAGTAQIQVRPAGGGINVYTIDFIAQAAQDVQLDMIYLNDDSLDAFVPTTLTYEGLVYETEMPVVSYDAKEGQTVSVLSNGQTVMLFVSATTNNQTQTAQYTLHFQKAISANCQLEMITLDGEDLEGFDPAQLHHTVTLPAGSSLPEVGYRLGAETQSAIMGQSEAGTTQIIVTAEDGLTRATYEVAFEVALYDDPTLENLLVEGVTFSFLPNKGSYYLSLEAGIDLPNLTLVTRPRQTTMVNNVNSNVQQIIVTAESGAQMTYTLNYNRVLSPVALLEDILVNGTHLDGFRPDSFRYEYPLTWRTKVIPQVYPVGQYSNQTITTYFCRPGGQMLIHVLSADGTHAQDYTIDFTLPQSSLVALKSANIFEALDFTYRKEQTEYLVTLPYGTTEAPIIVYEAEEPEQTIEYIAASLREESRIVVTAENGDQRIYRFRYQVADPLDLNILRALRVNGDEVNIEAGAGTYEVVLPYGATAWEVEYEKQFATQTVQLVDGGLAQPTVITVFSNRADEEPAVYTIVPSVTRYNPAVLAGFLIDDEPYTDFVADRYNYVINVTAAPAITAQPAEGVSVDIVEEDTKHIVLRATYGDFENDYTIYYYYINDQIPSNNFADWTIATYNNAQKPVGWTVPADVAQSYSYKVPIVGTTLTTTTGREVNPAAGNGVRLSTWREGDWNAIQGSIPGMMTIGSMSMSLTKSGGSTSSVSGSIAYRNTPDQVYMEYNPVSNNNITSWYMWVELGDASQMIRTTQTGNFNNKGTWRSFTKNLNYSGLGLISRLNILITSCNTENASDVGGSTIRTSDLEVRNLRFIHNSKLSSVTVDGEAATINGTDITYTLPDAEYAKYPELKFVGQKPDQAQVVEMNEEHSNVRLGLVHNYAEDGTYTTYTITITRPQSSLKTLESVKVAGQAIPGFSPAVHEYTVELPNGQTIFPDIDAIPTGKHEKVTIVYTDSSAVITATAETGEATEYTVKFVEAKSNDTELGLIDATGVEFVPATRVYHLTSQTLPAITFEKKSDGQTVDLKNGVLMVTAENGDTAAYRILPYVPATTGQLMQILADGTMLNGFETDRYEYTQDRPNITAFDRIDDKDSVVFVQRSTGQLWQVFGSADHEYELLYPTSISTDTLLAGIFVDGELIEDFVPTTFDYTLLTDTAVSLTVEANEPLKQQVEIVCTDRMYAITVTAESGAQAHYRVVCAPDLSHDATLAQVWYDSIAIVNFNPETEEYTVILPSPETKVAEPKMPDLTYLVAQEGASVVVSPARLNEPVYLDVTAEDGLTTKQYTVTIQSEPSHNTSLTGIIVNGELVEHFETGRHYYSVYVQSEEVTINWTSEDNFQTVTTTENADGTYTIEVKAQDGINTENYFLEIYRAQQSNIVTLSNILLDNVPMSEFRTDINKDLVFNPGNNSYSINLPQGTTLLPEVSAQLMVEGQQVDIQVDQETMVVTLLVTAKNEIDQNTYTLSFKTPKSKNADLQAIYYTYRDKETLQLVRDSVNPFYPDTLFYPVTLPMGITEIQRITGLESDDYQTIEEQMVDLGTESKRATIHVTAGDGETEKSYVVLFSFSYSDNCLLDSLMLNLETVKDFKKDSFEYYFPLPAGTIGYPELGCEKGDPDQVVRIDTLPQYDNRLIRQINVTAADKVHNSIYTITTEILKWDIDTLSMIYIGIDSLQGFDPQGGEFYHTLPAGTTMMPIITIEGADPTAVVSQTYLVDTLSHSLGQLAVVSVKAENGSEKIYTIHFPLALSSDASLSLITLNEKELLSGFNESQLTYKVLLDLDAPVPVVTGILKYEDLQDLVQQTLEDPILHNDTVLLTVTAEDQVTTKTYRVTFEHAKSANAQLEDLILSGVTIEFAPDLYRYQIEIPYGTTVLPEIEPVKAEEEQVVEINYYPEVAGVTQVDIEVTAPNGDNYEVYSLYFTFGLSHNAEAAALLLDGEAIADFRADSLYYLIEFPIGTDPSYLYNLNELTVVPADENATVELMQIEGENTLIATITAPDEETQMVYIIDQVILKSDNNYIAQLYLGENRDTLPGFSSLLDYTDAGITYTYLLVAGTTPPEVTAELQDERSECSIKAVSVGDTTIIICTSESGLDREYRIVFTYDPISDAAKPQSTDVLVQVLPNGQIRVATIRRDVTFFAYDASGHCVNAVNVPLCSPNERAVDINQNGQEQFYNFWGDNGIVIQLSPGTVYTYAFFESQKHVITSGRIITLP